MLPVDYHPGASRDFDESFDWYLERSPRTAVRFAAAIDATLEIIAASPLRFMSIDQIHRECGVKRFPFRIVYRVVDQRILVVAIAHHRRQRGFWNDRA